MEVIQGLSNMDFQSSLLRPTMSVHSGTIPWEYQPHAVEGWLQKITSIREGTELGSQWNRHSLWLQICLPFPQLFYQNHYPWTTNKASAGDGIPVELFRILKDNAVKALHSICQQIWKTQQWPQDWKRSVFIPMPRKAMPKNAQTTAQLHSSHMLAK